MEGAGKLISRLGAMPMVAPPPPRKREQDLELVNLNTATAATEIWFNSPYHQRTFIEAAKLLVGRHPELASHNPMAEVAAKSVVMPPPIDLNLVPYVKSLGKAPPRDQRAIFVDTRDANFRILNAALSELGLARRKVPLDHRRPDPGPLGRLATPNHQRNRRSGPGDRPSRSRRRPERASRRQLRHPGHSRITGRLQTRPAARRNLRRPDPREFAHRMSLSFQRR